MGVEKITIENLRASYTYTHYHQNGCNLDEVFANGHSMSISGGFWGGKFDLIHYLIRDLKQIIPNTKFRSVVLRSDGGIQNFMILYELNIEFQYNIIVGQFTSTPNGLNSLQDFTDWLNRHQERIEYLIHQPL
jgi:hypothetical protein